MIMTPTYQITYAGKDVSNDFAPLLESITYREYLENKASEVELSLDNSKGFFFNDWYPAIDDKISIKIGYKNQALMNCGEFFVDDITLSGSRRGDTCNIRAISAKPSTLFSPVQIKNEEDTPISDIVNRIASDLGFSVKGDTSGNWSGVQKGSGLSFLHQLARETGRILKIEGTDLVFFLLSKIKSGIIVNTIYKGNEIGYSITDNASGRLSKCTVKSWRPDKKLLVVGEYDAGIDGGGAITIWDDCEGISAANSRAKNYVEDKNKERTQFSITMPGDVLYRSGVGVKTSGFGMFSKTWYVSEVVHTISKSGYFTELNLRE